MEPYRINPTEVLNKPKFIKRSIWNLNRPCFKRSSVKGIFFVNYELELAPRYGSVSLLV